MDATTYDRAADRLIALSDEELAVAFVDLADAFAVADEDSGWTFSKLIDTLDRLVAETLERVSPEAGRAAVVHHWQDDGSDELLDALEAMRQRTGARLLRDAL